MNKVEEFKQYQKNIAKKEYLVSILGWELLTTAPKDSKKYLIDVKTELELEVFNLYTNSKYGDLLEECIDSDEFNDLGEIEQLFIKELYRKFKLHKRVPNTFFEKYAKQRSITNVIWEEAKQANDYDLFKPYLAQIIKLTKEFYQYMYPDKNVYDAMLDTYEDGMTSDVIDNLFEQLKERLIPLIDKYKDSKPITGLNQYYSDSDLMDCAKYLLDYIGFNLNKGTLGIYPHGYTEKINLDDVRIAFKHTNNPIEFVSTIIHEGGHGIFEQNIDPKIGSLTNASIDGLYALHESQSRFYENILGRNINFWIPIYDDIKQKLHLTLSLEEFCEQLNHVCSGPIRTDADELTYCLHIIIRYEIEKDIFNNNLNVDELPQAWNKKMKDYLNIEVSDYSHGILQDVHWADGSFGYFPSYLLGTIYDGLFIKCIERDLGSIDEILRNGDIKKITNYLNNNVHINGGVYNSKKVFDKLGIKAITANPILDYFEYKYDK